MNKKVAAVEVPAAEVAARTVAETIATIVVAIAVNAVIAITIAGGRAAVAGRSCVVVPAAGLIFVRDRMAARKTRVHVPALI